MVELCAENIIRAAIPLASLGLPAETMARYALANDGAAGDTSDRARTRSLDVAFIHHCGYWSHYDHRTKTSTWPVPQGYSAAELSYFAESHRMLYGTPTIGDVFIQWSTPQKRFIRAGIVGDIMHLLRVGPSESYEVYTIEGDTDEAGQFEGGFIKRVKRTLSPTMGDRFFRWTEFASRMPAAQPVPKLTPRRST